MILHRKTMSTMERVAVLLPREILEAIDKQRALAPRSAFLRQLILKALGYMAFEETKP